MGTKLLQSLWGLSIFAWVCRMIDKYVEVTDGSAFAMSITLIAIGSTLLLAPWMPYLKDSDANS